MTAVFDYGAGNLRSVSNTLESIGADFEIVGDPSRLASAERIILPGEGNYGQLLRSLDRLGARAGLCGRIAAGVPFLGICLGLQALFDSSEEADEEGLGIYPGRVTRFPKQARVPHMGWNCLSVKPSSRLLRGVGPRPYVYFANSYYVGLDFCAALERGNTFGVQFHPEKSGPLGQRIVRNFLEVQPC